MPGKQWNCSEPVRLLFVGEAPPASGRCFPAGNSGLYRAMFEVFAAADASITRDGFHAVFHASGCALVDLCETPVDRLPAAQRRAACQAAEPRLAGLIAEAQPLMVATLLRSIEANVERAAALAKWRGRMLPLPYPGRWRHLQVDFAARLTPVVRELLAQGRSGRTTPR